MYPDEHLEKLINRSLDGELTETEELELARVLLRSRDAREAFEQMQAIDRYAGQAVREGLHVGPVERQIPNRWRNARPSGRTARRRWVWPTAAAAAALAAAALAAAWLMGPDTRTNDNAIAVIDTPEPVPVAPATGSLERNRPLQRIPGSGHPGLVDRQIAHDWIAVQGPDGAVYWIELNRRRTLERPRSTGAIRLASDSY